MWRKRLSLILFLVGLAFFIDISVRGIRSAVDMTNSLEIYRKQAIDYRLSPALAESVKKQLNEDNIQGAEDPFSGTSSSWESKLPTEAVGFIKIPKINEIIPLYMGASESNLANGCAHITGTDLPLSGKGTHTFIAGHRGYYGPTYFLYIDHLVPGDLIHVSYLGDEAVYVVTGNELIDPTDDAKLTERVIREEMLTLLTCHPFPTAQQRLLVYSRRLSNEEIDKNTTLSISTSEQATALDTITISEQMATQEVKAEGIVKKIGELGQQSIWLYIGIIVLGGSLFIFVCWRLIGTFLGFFSTKIGEKN